MTEPLTLDDYSRLIIVPRAQRMRRDILAAVTAGDYDDVLADMIADHLIGECILDEEAFGAVFRRWLSRAASA